VKYTLLAAAFIVAVVAPCYGQQSEPHRTEFNAFYASFLSAVHANNKEKLADLITFPIEDWSIEQKGDIQTGMIKDRNDFLARYELLFTSFMRSHIPRGKIEALADGRYILIWHDAGAEFSFEFAYITGVGYRVSAYSIGPE
jgi:hypothetical protein